MLSALKAEAARAARKTGFLAGGLFFIIIGLGFLTGSLYILIAMSEGALVASAIIGAVYAGLGLVLIGIAKMIGKGDAYVPPQAVHASAHASATPPPPGTPPGPLQFAQAFLYGMEAAANERARR